jgi:hypothetical protein
MDVVRPPPAATMRGPQVVDQLGGSIEPIHSGLAFLAQASARHVLVEHGEMEIDEAISGLVPAFEDLVGPLCWPDGCCERRRQAEADDARRERERRQIRPPTPACTVEAILYCVRERGPAALREPANLARLRDCDKAALAEIDRRLRLREAAHA